ncbi:hypothetical protein NC653_036529 [Populus alba x Populus x berolinensis]|uniref:Secreted protein n=1 Tax=Populus alba x Populus x berolinensis TaxID=444605 RepID=A0AAD6PVV9_9ROSI|nr:hypothetical protein NC653_036529 [Populus alba x Populus x berolinensis]
MLLLLVLWCFQTADTFMPQYFERLIELRLISKKLHVSIQTKICACVRSLCAWLPACHLHSSSERRWPWWMACKDSCML